LCIIVCPFVLFLSVVGFTICAISAYHHLSFEFESRSWRGVLNTTLCDQVSKGQTMIHKTLHRKLKIKTNETHYKSGKYSDAPEG
jgi:hypothetical protein